MSAEHKIGIVAALEREIAPLIDGWTLNSVGTNGKGWKFYESGSVVAVAGGIGRDPARFAAQAMLDRYPVEVVISAGLAGAADRRVEVGTVLTPTLVIDADSREQFMVPMGAEFRRAFEGEIVLVTASGVCDKATKAVFAERFHAHAVDMEASGVAQAVRDAGKRFACLKAVSDGTDSELPPVQRFVNRDGSFDTSGFALYVTVRPLLWGKVKELAKGSSAAVDALCASLKDMTSEEKLEQIVGEMWTTSHLIKRA